MHIADGIVSGPVIGAGFAVTAVLAAATMRNIDMEEIPKLSVATAVFFVANFIHIPLVVASIHLILNGLVGVILGKRAFVAIMLGVVLQSFFGFGGVTVIGVNSVMLGGGALFAYGIWQLRNYVSIPNKEVVFGALAGALGILFSGCILALALISSGEAFLVSAQAVLGYHVVLMFIEGAVTGACVGFLAKAKPDLLAGYKLPKLSKLVQSS
jgi:cobalt/nickel transport system permease protein